MAQVVGRLDEVEVLADGMILTYSDLETSRGHVGKYLTRIAREEADAGYPPLSAIVVGWRGSASPTCSDRPRFYARPRPQTKIHLAVPLRITEWVSPPTCRQDVRPRVQRPQRT